MFEVTGDAARINRDWRHDREAFQPLATPALQALRDLVAECRFDVPDGLPKALATLVGFFAYETIGLVERIPRAPGAGLGLPDMVFVRPTTILVFDRLADELFLIAPIWPDADGALDRMIETAQDRLDTIAARLSTASVSADRALTDALPTDIAANPATPPAQFAAMVAKAQGLYRRGRHFSGRAVAALLDPLRPAALRPLPRAAPHQPLALPLSPRPRRLRADRLVSPKSSSASAMARSRSGRSPAPARAAAPAPRMPRTAKACSPIPRNAPSI